MDPGQPACVACAIDEGVLNVTHTTTLETM